MTGDEHNEVGPEAGSTVSVEQFVTLAKAVKGAGAAEIIHRALDAPGIYLFRDFMDLPNIKELAEGEHEMFWNLLNIFAFGTYKDYVQSEKDLPPLSVNQKKKLQQLTIISLSEQEKCIPYKILLEELGITDLRELEDIIIEAIYAEIIQAKLDQSRSLLEVDTTIGRDIRPENISIIEKTLESWCDACENVLSTLQKQVDLANAEKTAKIKRKEQQDQEIFQMRKTVKAHSQQEQEEMMTDSREAKGIEKTPKKVSRAGLRNPSKYK